MVSSVVWQVPYCKHWQMCRSVKPLNRSVGPFWKLTQQMAFRQNCSQKKLETNCHLRFSELISFSLCSESICSMKNTRPRCYWSSLKKKRNYHIIHILPSTVWQGHHKIRSHKVQISVLKRTTCINTLSKERLSYKRFWKLTTLNKTQPYLLHFQNTWIISSFLELQINSHCFLVT